MRESWYIQSNTNASSISHNFTSTHYTHTPSCHTEFILPHLRCTWQPDQQFLKGLDRLFKHAWHENAHTQTDRPDSFWAWPQLSGPSEMRGLSSSHDPPTVWNPSNGRANLGGTQANNLQTSMDIIACVAYGGRQDKEVGLCGKAMSNKCSVAD